MYLQQLLKRMIFLIVAIFFIPIKYVVKKRKIVILQTHSRQLYCDNTRYLYEFLSEKKDLDVYWVTDNLEIKQHIADKGWKYITWHNPIKMIWVALRAKVVIDNGDKFFNAFNITNNGSVLKISLQHGCGPKITLRNSKDVKITIEQINNIGKFDYVNFPSKYSSYRMGKNMYFLPDEKIMSFGYPRCDQFFDKSYVDKHFQEKNITKKLCSNFKDKDKVILYTPTWRPYEYNFPLFEMRGFYASEFNNWLRSNNLFFFITNHSKSGNMNWANDLDRMVFIDRDSHPLFDINKFMLEVDVLLNDYSTTSTDFSLLNRPQLFYMPDYEFYSSKKGFFEDYRDIMPGKEVFSYDDLQKALLGISLNSESYVNEYLLTTKKLQKKYYDICFKHSTIKLFEFVRKLL